MKVRTGNPNFTYEISCDQICGAGHFSMRGIIVVEKPEEYKKWIAEQKPEYYALFPDKNPMKAMPDSTKILASVLPVKIK